MIFTYRFYDALCKKLATGGRVSIPARELTGGTPAPALVLKHDVETAPKRALRLAKIEKKYGHRASYYVQGYLLTEKNLPLFSEIAALGHEVSYHYDCLDAAHGDLDAAITIFDENKTRFEAAGFPLSTVCQHGNPVAERVGYTSNRDFFRSEKVCARYPGLSDIMVNYSKAHGVSFDYFSDAGQRFSKIYDPENNDRVPSEEKNIVYQNEKELLSALTDTPAIISTHPHRYRSSAFLAVLHRALFFCLRAVAKLLSKIPLFRRMMSRFYFLAKKI